MRTAEFEGKVASIAGAARGQGRSHAVRFAQQEGADIIAVDLCDQIDNVAGPFALLVRTRRRIEPQARNQRAVIRNVIDATLRECMLLYQEPAAW